MSQKKSPEFSHITVGNPFDDASSAQDEEVITIGAVGVPSTAKQSPSKPTEHEKHSAEKDVDAHPAETDNLNELGDPMPLIQKIVLIACAIGVVVTITFLIWFWATQR